LQKQIAAYAHQIDENSRNEELSRQLSSQLDTVLQEKKKLMVDLQMKCTQIQEQMNANFEQEKLQLKQKFEDSVQLKEVRTFQGTYLL